MSRNNEPVAYNRESKLNIAEMLLRLLLFIVNIADTMSLHMLLIIEKVSISGTMSLQMLLITEKVK